MFSIFKRSRRKRAWNRGKLMGQKPPLKPEEIWSIRIRLQMSKRRGDLALFNLALDSKLRACDLTKLRVKDVLHGDQVVKRATIVQQKTQQPVQFEITSQTRSSIVDWLRVTELGLNHYLFLSRRSPHPSTDPIHRSGVS